MISITVTEDDGVKATPEDRALRHLQITKVMAGEPAPKHSSVEALDAARFYTSSIIADMLAYAESIDMNLEDVLRAAVEEFNAVAYHPVEITVTGAI